MSLNLSKVVPIYQNAIDSLIQQMGKQVSLHFKSTFTTIDPEYQDLLRPEDMRKPLFKTPVNTVAPIEVENTKTIVALIEENPKDYESYGVRINDPRAIIQLKTFLTDVPDLMRCEFIIPHLLTTGILNRRFKLCREPIPIGLQVDRYAVSFWERI